MNTEPSKFSLQGIWATFKRGFRKQWLLMILLIVLGAAILGAAEWFFFKPQYTASATFTVYVKNTVVSTVSDYNSATAKQLEKTFPDILTSGVLSERVMGDLGETELPKIEAEAISDANLIKLKVTGSDPVFCEKVLQSVIKNYPDIAERVVGPTEMTIIDSTGIPQTPNNQRNCSVAIRRGALLGAVIAVLLIYAYGSLKKTIMGRDDVQSISNAAYLGALPTVVQKKRSVDKEQVISIKTVKDKSYRESFRTISARLNKALKQHGYETAMVCSAIPGEGKTTVSFNLALALAEQKRKVVLIDCDLRSPSLYRMLKQKKCEGITNWYADKAELKDIIHTVIPERLDVIFAGNPTDDGAEILGSLKIHELLLELRKSYDIVLLDTPPCSMLTDATELAEEADCAVMVIKQDYASRDSVINGLNNLQDSGTPVIGYIMNEYSGGVSGRYGYGYGEYGYGYGKYGYGKYGYGESGKKSANTEAAAAAGAAALGAARLADENEKAQSEDNAKSKGIFGRWASKADEAEKEPELPEPIVERVKVRVKPAESDLRVSNNQAKRITAVRVKPLEQDAVSASGVEPEAVKINLPGQEKEPEAIKAPAAVQKVTEKILPEAEAVESEEEENPKTKPSKRKKNKREKKKSKMGKGSKILLTIVGILVGLALLLVIAVLTLNFIGKKSMTADSGINAAAIGAEAQDGNTIRYKGKLYRYNDSISSIFLMGIDNYDKAEGAKEGNQSDANVMAVIDPYNKKLTLLAISRDTMCEFEKLDEEGKSEGMAKAQLALAYAYGDGAERSCEITTEAVSKLFYDLKIPAYASIYMNGIVDLVDIVGGVTVTPQNSFGSFVEGSQVTIGGNLARQYIQYRNGTINGNNERMSRQAQVLKALVNKALARAKDDPKSILDLYNTAKDDLTTNLNTAKIVYLAGQAAKLKFDNEIYKVPGHSEMGEQNHAVYVVDEDEFYDMIVNTYYIPVD